MDIIGQVVLSPWSFLHALLYPDFSKFITMATGMLFKSLASVSSMSYYGHIRNKHNIKIEKKKPWQVVGPKSATISLNRV